MKLGDFQFLDDVTVKQLAQKLQAPIIKIAGAAGNLFRVILAHLLQTQIEGRSVVVLR